MLKNLAKTKLLILDDFGLAPLTAQARYDLLEILEDRYGRTATIVVSQLPVERWHEMLGDPTIADAILDRLVHTAYRLDLKGESMRKLMAPKHGHAGAALVPVGPQGILPRDAPAP
jgi:DNA replication protein DnaC